MPVIECLQNETVRIDAKQAETIGLATRQLTFCVGVLIKDREGNASLTHMDSRTDINFIEAEVKYMKGPYEIYVIQLKKEVRDQEYGGGATIAYRVTNYTTEILQPAVLHKIQELRRSFPRLSTPEIIAKLESVVSEGHIVSTATGCVLFEKNQLFLDIKDDDLRKKGIDSNRNSFLAGKCLFERSYEVRCSTAPRLPTVVFNRELGWQSFSNGPNAATRIVLDNFLSAPTSEVGKEYFVTHIRKVLSIVRENVNLKNVAEEASSELKKYGYQPAKHTFTSSTTHAPRLLTPVPGAINNARTTGIKHFERKEFKEAIHAFKVVVDHWRKINNDEMKNNNNASEGTRREFASSLYNLGRAEMENSSNSIAAALLTEAVKLFPMDKYLDRLKECQKNNRSHVFNTL